MRPLFLLASLFFPAHGSSSKRERENRIDADDMVTFLDGFPERRVLQNLTWPYLANFPEGQPKPVNDIINSVLALKLRQSSRDWKREIDGLNISQFLRALWWFHCLPHLEQQPESFFHQRQAHTLKQCLQIAGSPTFHDVVPVQRDALFYRSIKRKLISMGVILRQHMLKHARTALHKAPMRPSNLLYTSLMNMIEKYAPICEFVSTPVNGTISFANDILRGLMRELLPDVFAAMNTMASQQAHKLTTKPLERNMVDATLTFGWIMTLFRYKQTIQLQEGVAKLVNPTQLSDELTLLEKAASRVSFDGHWLMYVSCRMVMLLLHDDRLKPSVPTVLASKKASSRSTAGSTQAAAVKTSERLRLALPVLNQVFGKGDFMNVEECSQVIGRKMLKFLMHYGHATGFGADGRCITVNVIGGREELARWLDFALKVPNILDSCSDRVIEKLIRVLAVDAITGGGLYGASFVVSPEIRQTLKERYLWPYYGKHIIFPLVKTSRHRDAAVRAYYRERTTLFHIVDAFFAYPTDDAKFVALRLAFVVGEMPATTASSSTTLSSSSTTLLSSSTTSSSSSTNSLSSYSFESTVSSSSVASSSTTCSFASFSASPSSSSFSSPASLSSSTSSFAFAPSSRSFSLRETRRELSIWTNLVELIVGRICSQDALWNERSRCLQCLMEKSEHDLGKHQNLPKLVKSLSFAWLPFSNIGSGGEKSLTTHDVTQKSIDMEGFRRDAPTDLASYLNAVANLIRLNCSLKTCAVAADTLRHPWTFSDCIEKAIDQVPLLVAVWAILMQPLIVSDSYRSQYSKVLDATLERPSKTPSQLLLQEIIVTPVVDDIWRILSRHNTSNQAFMQLFALTYTLDLYDDGRLHLRAHDPPRGRVLSLAIELSSLLLTTYSGQCTELQPLRNFLMTIGPQQVMAPYFEILEDEELPSTIADGCSRWLKRVLKKRRGRADRATERDDEKEEEEPTDGISHEELRQICDLLEGPTQDAPAPDEEHQHTEQVDESEDDQGDEGSDDDENVEAEENTEETHSIREQLRSADHLCRLTVPAALFDPTSQKEQLIVLLREHVVKPILGLRSPCMERFFLKVEDSKVIDQDGPSRQCVELLAKYIRSQHLLLETSSGLIPNLEVHPQELGRLLATVVIWSLRLGIRPPVYINEDWHKMVFAPLEEVVQVMWETIERSYKAANHSSTIQGLVLLVAMGKDMVGSTELALGADIVPCRHIIDEVATRAVLTMADWLKATNVKIERRDAVLELDFTPGPLFELYKGYVTEELQWRALAFRLAFLEHVVEAVKSSFIDQLFDESEAIWRSLQAQPFTLDLVVERLQVKQPIEDPAELARQKAHLWHHDIIDPEGNVGLAACVEYFLKHDLADQHELQNRLNHLLIIVSNTAMPTLSHDEPSIRLSPRLVLHPAPRDNEDVFEDDYAEDEDGGDLHLEAETDVDRFIDVNTCQRMLIIPPMRDYMQLREELWSLLSASTAYNNY